MIQIKCRYTGNVLWESEKDTMKEALEEAVKNNANLRYANLRYANLDYANLRDAYLRDANLRYANLDYANLDYANLDYANLGNAYLSYANLDNANLRNANLDNANLDYAYLDNVKKPPVNSHDFISELLYRKAETEAQIDFSSRVLRQKEECWEYFIQLSRKKRVFKWAYQILSEWPEFLEVYNKNK